MSLWAWALEAWSRPGVEQACLELQDQGDQSIALLLWWAWMLAEGRPTNPELARLAADVARPIETKVLRPMRSARRALAAKPEMVGRERIEEARQAIRRAELGLERALLEAVEALAPEPALKTEPASLEAMAPLFEAWNGPPSKEMISGPAATFVKALL